MKTEVDEDSRFTLQVIFVGEDKMVEISQSGFGESRNREIAQPTQPMIKANLPVPVQEACSMAAQSKHPGTIGFEG